MGTFALPGARQREVVVLHLRYAGLLVAASIASASCDTTGPAGPPAGIEILSGQSQIGPVDLTLPEPIAVRVVDGDGRRVDGFPIIFKVIEGDGTLGPAELKRVSTLTNSGEATVKWRLGTRAGPQAVTVAVEAFEPLTFQALALPGPPVSLAAVSGSGQRGPIGQELPEPFMVAVLDEFDNGIPDVTLEWEVAAGAGDLSSPTVKTDSAGIASVAFTPGGVGEILVKANVVGFDPATFVAVGQALLIDPAGDQFASAEHYIPPDIVQLKAWVEAGELQIRIWFTDFQLRSDWADDEALAGYVDLDIDQNPATGATPFTDRLRPGSGSTGIGAEFSVALFTTNGRFDVLDKRGNVIGSVRSRFAGNTVRMWIPLSLIGDDGLVDLAVIVGTVQQLTDIAPDDGSLVMVGPAGGAR